MALFTHSYYGEGEAELNDLAQYITDAQVVKARPAVGGLYTPEYRELQAKGYRFCMWLHVGENYMLMVKPSDAVLEHVAKAYGTKADIESLTPTKFRFCVAVRYTDGFKTEAIVGEFHWLGFTEQVALCQKTDAQRRVWAEYLERTTS
jgi:hypothetical protein